MLHQRREQILNKSTNVVFISLIALLVGFVAGCATIREFPLELPKRIVFRTPFDELCSELYSIADVERVGREELIVRFPGIALFGVDEYSLLPEAKRDLEDVAKILSRHPDFIVTIEGHTDNRGRESYNQWLSERRSRVVAGFLVDAGLDPDRIQVVGYGESRPLATNETAEGRQRNRRVEIHIKSQPLQPEQERTYPETDSPHTMIPAAMAA